MFLLGEPSEDRIAEFLCAQRDAPFRTERSEPLDTAWGDSPATRWITTA